MEGIPQNCQWLIILSLLELANLGCIPFLNKPVLCPKEVILQTRLRPLDQHGKLLGMGDECIERWPIWLPKTWRIAYYKEQGALAQFLADTVGHGWTSRLIQFLEGFLW